MTFIDRLGVTLLLLMPIGTLAIKKWSNSLFLLAVIVSIVALTQKRGLLFEKSQWILILVLTFAAPFLIDLLMQAVRGEIVSAQLDAPSRLLLGVPILFFCLNKKIQDPRLFTLVVGVSVLATFMSILLDPRGVNFWGRWSTSSVDPNSLGCITAVVAGVLIYLCLVHFTTRHWIALSLAFAALLIGLVVLLKSQSRGGWIVLGLLAPLIIVLAKKQELKGSLLIIFAIFSAATLFIFQDPALQSRAQSIYLETKNWWETPREAASSIGVRLNMLEASWALIKHSPFVGYGDHGYVNVLASGVLGSFSPAAVDAIVNTPHNEIIGKTLKSGLLGGFAAGLVFLIPGVLFFTSMKSGKALVNYLPASLGLIIVIGFFLSGMSAGILGLTYLSSLYSASVLSLAGVVLSMRNLADE